MAAPSLEAARPAVLRLSFAPDPASAREASMAVRKFLAEHGVAERELFSYELCASEAGNNAIEHAVGRSRRLRPVAEVHFTATQVELRVTDHTPGFALPERIPTPPTERDRGRGLFLMQSFMDEMKYLRGPGENMLVMRKRLAGAPAAKAAPVPRPAAAYSPAIH